MTARARIATARRGSSRDAEFEAFVRLRRTAMVRTALALSVGDAHLAEDVVQRALVNLYLAWPRVRGLNVAAYARRVLVNAFLDERRRPFARRERTMRDVPDHAAGDDGDFGRLDDLDDLDTDLLAALRTLPRGMRSAVVLRYVDDLSVEETAHALNCTVGNVKSQTSRGLAKLRAELSRTSVSEPAGPTR